MKKSAALKVLTGMFISFTLFSCSGEKLPNILNDIPTLDTGKSENISGNYTGIIIDARGFGVRASMSPVIYDEGSNNLYPGNISVSNDYLVNSGIVSYSYSTEASARNNPRAGSTPLLIKALKADGINNFDVVVSRDDALKLKSERGQDLMNSFKVVFLLD